MNEVIYKLNAEKPTTTENILNKILLGSKITIWKQVMMAEFLFNYFQGLNFQEIEI